MDFKLETSHFSQVAILGARRMANATRVMSPEAPIRVKKELTRELVEELCSVLFERG